MPCLALRHYHLRATTDAQMRVPGIRCQIAGTVCLIAGGLALVVALALAYDLLAHKPADSPDSELATCQAALDAIGLALRTWATDHHNQFPFNVSTNTGGTLQLCARGGDGFDSNAWMHFRVASNELSEPAFLVCPKDRKHKPARDFQSFGPKNVTYRLRTGPNVTQDNPNEVMVVCPLHGIAVCTDGHLERRGPPVVDSWRYATSFCQGVGQILICVGTGALLVGLGAFLKLTHNRGKASYDFSSPNEKEQ